MSEEERATVRARIAKGKDNLETQLYVGDLPQSAHDQPREVTKREEHKHDVLQAECISLTREFLVNTQRLEGEVDKLRAENDQLAVAL